MYELQNYDFPLPVELIAQLPPEERGESRLLALDRSQDRIDHRRFGQLLDYLKPGDVVVVNDTRVVPARLLAVRDTGGGVELLVLDPYKDAELANAAGHTCLFKRARGLGPGDRLTLANGCRTEVLTPLRQGRARVRFLSEQPILDMLEQIGLVPLPPYIRRDRGEPLAADRFTYQTVYARKSGAVAAPTAGLHFSPPMLEQMRCHGVRLAKVTLHVGYGTFAPVRVTDIRDHVLHPEFAEIAPDTAEQLEEARRRGQRILAVGTTVVRTLEWAARDGSLTPFSGACDHYIYPGYQFRVVKALLTNFHLPKSSLLLLVAAFAGKETILAAYRQAVQQGYRFFSYGDAMLIV
jgi:S-adenosylmethionine:tRNA ribosyltransferase-isomerase